MPALGAALRLAALQLLLLQSPPGAAAASPQRSPVGGADRCYVGAALQRLPELTAAACCEACAADATKQCGCWEIRREGNRRTHA